MEALKNVDILPVYYGEKLYPAILLHDGHISLRDIAAFFQLRESSLLAVLESRQVPLRVDGQTGLSLLGGFKPTEILRITGEGNSTVDLIRY